MHMKFKHKETEDAAKEEIQKDIYSKEANIFLKILFFCREHLILAFGYFSIANIRFSFAV